MTANVPGNAPEDAADDRAVAEIEAPQFGEELAPPRSDAALVRRLLTRRSSTAAVLGEPGPGPAELDRILRAAARVPDHGKLSPWRFILFEGESRARFGEVLAGALLTDEPHAPEDRVAFERRRFLRAPVVVAVVSSLKESPKIPDWEQMLSAGAVCQTLLLAAGAHGYAAQWLTEWYAYHPSVQAELGLEGAERIAGFFYIGSAQEAPRERQRPDMGKLVSRWSGNPPHAEGRGRPPADHGGDPKAHG